MPRPPITPVGLPDAKRVARFANLLTSVARAHSAPSADARFDRFLARAERSAEATEAAFAAGQRLRDLDDIDAGEAAYILHSIYDAHDEAYCEADGEYQRLIETYVGSPAARSDDEAHERLIASLTTRSRTIESQFLTARGEMTLASLCVDEPEAFSALCAEGQMSLVDDKPAASDVDVPPPSQETSARIGQRILALASSETLRDTLREHSALWHALSGGDPASAVAAVQEMREVGLITPLEAHGLLDEIVGGVVVDMQERDRECSRLDRALAARRASLGLDAGDPWPDDVPFAIRVLEYRRDQRSERLMVSCLRRFGEHAMANLLLEAPDEYERRREQAPIGAWADG